MILQEEYNLNLEPQLSKKYVKVSQYDTGRRLLITLIKNDGSMFKIPLEASASINGLKPDEKGFRYDCSIENNKVVVEMKEQMTVLAGYVKCEILLSKGGERIATANFMLSVEESPLSENTPISSTDIPLLQKAIEASEIVLSVEKTVKGYSESASKSAQSSQASAESAVNASNASAESANSASQSATNASAKATEAKKSETNAKLSETNASNSAKKAQTSAESAIQTKAEIEQLKKETIEQASTLTESAKQEISTVKDATVTEVTELKNSTVSEITSLKDSTIEAVTLLKDNAKAEADRATESSASAKVQAEKAQASADSIANVTSDVEKLKEDLPNKITKFYASNQGEIHITDSDNGKIQDMMIYGKSSQDGTPSVENPVEIKSVVNPTIKVCGKNLLPPNLKYMDKVKINIKKGVILTLICKDGIVSTGGNLRFEKADGDVVWFGFDAGNVKQQITLYDDVVSLEYLIDSRPSENYALYIGDGNTYEPYKEQSIQLPITLNAIPVSSGGNVTIDGQQYIADYVDVERRKVVRMCESGTFNTKNGYVDEKYRLAIRIDIPAQMGDMECMFSKFKWTSWETCASGTLMYIKNIKKANGELYTAQELKDLSLEFDIIYQLSKKQEIDLTTEQVQALKELSTYYPVTHITVGSEQLDGYTVFNYPISLANGWNYVKQQLNDNRDYIYDMDLQSAEAYVNSEYAVTLTELEV